MKVKRQKRVRRILNYFKTHFGLRAPYKVLLDGTFCQVSLTKKVNIKEQLPNYLLVPNVSYCSSPCAITETDKLGAQLYGASLILKGLTSSSLLECGHGKSPLPAVKCIKSLVKGSPNEGLIIATQDPELRIRIRKIPGIPIMYLHGNAPTLEDPSKETKAFVEKRGEGLSRHEEKVIADLKEKELPHQEEPRKKKKIKGPNPLSCLKSKKKKSSQATPSSNKKRIRNRKNKSIETDS